MQAALSLAYAYLQKPPPYQGRCRRVDSGLMARAGGKWNPKTQTCDAHDLLSFVRMIETQRWHPLALTDMCDIDEAVNIAKKRLDQEQKEQHQKFAEKRDLEFGNKDASSTNGASTSGASQKAAGRTAEEEERLRRAQLGVSESTPQQLDKLLNLYGIVPQMVEPAMVHDRLGPWGGQSPAFRLLRGLKYGHITKQQVIDGRFNIRDEEQDKSKATENAKMSGVKRSAANTHKRVLQAAGTKPTNKEEPSDTPQPWLLPDYQFVTPDYADTVCQVCHKVVGGQFMDCDCVYDKLHNFYWEQCTNCPYKRMYHRNTSLASCIQQCKCKK